MVSIGITGSFAVGKSRIMNILSNKGYKIFIADEIVKQFYDDIYNQQQIGQFHSDLVNFNKKRMTALFFSDSIFSKKVTDLIHPYVEKHLQSFIKQNANQEVIFSEIPLLFEADFVKYFDYIVTIYCSEKIRKNRAKTKPNFSFKKLKQIEKRQLPQREKIKLAHFTVNTDVNLLKLDKKIDQLIQKIKCQSSQK